MWNAVKKVFKRKKPKKDVVISFKGGLHLEEPIKSSFVGRGSGTFIWKINDEEIHADSHAGAIEKYKDKRWKRLK